MKYITELLMFIVVVETVARWPPTIKSLITRTSSIDLKTEKCRP